MAASSHGDFRDYTWLDHVSAAARLPRPRSDAELAALLDAAFAQDLSCLVKPLPLRRAPGINDMVDIDALLLLTWPVAGGDEQFGALIESQRVSRENGQPHIGMYVTIMCM